MFVTHYRAGSWIPMSVIDLGWCVRVT